MFRSKVLMIALITLTICACSKNRTGTGDGDGDDAMGGGNIPGAEAGEILKDINFAFDSFSLTDAAKGTLRANGTWLSDNPKYAVTIEGHCDERGTNEYNMALGERRAKTVSDYMKSLGVATSRMSNVSYGEEIPLDTAHTEAAWVKNRRAHFKINN
jgi:peptidoglycan-associated lipoprotein